MSSSNSYFKPSYSLWFLAVFLLLISTSTYAQTPENITLTTSSIKGGTTLTEEALFNITHPSGVVYTIEADTTFGGADVTFITGEEIVLNPGFEVQNEATFCAYINPIGDNFAKLKDKLDGSYHQVKKGVLRIILQEDYFVSSEPISLTISDESGNTIYNNTLVTKEAGVNSIEINLRDIGGFSKDAFYLVQVTKEKNNPKLLRIQYK